MSTNGGGTWGDIAGATGSDCSTPATVTGDNGKQYRAVATNSAGAVNSIAATLTVWAIAWPVPRFVVGTGATVACVTDNLTGLMWPAIANLAAAARTWQQALDDANALDLCGFTDWRLPNVSELESLVNGEVVNSATFLNSQGFTNVQVVGGYYYWSSSNYAAIPAKRVGRRHVRRPLVHRR